MSDAHPMMADMVHAVGRDGNIYKLRDYAMHNGCLYYETAADDKALHIQGLGRRVGIAVAADAGSIRVGLFGRQYISTKTILRFWGSGFSFGLLIGFAVRWLMRF